LPRPRSIEIMSTPVFGERTARLRRFFRVEGGVD
jgi:hypothetical protein